MSEYRVSLAEEVEEEEVEEEEEKKKEKSRFLTASGSVGRRPFWTVWLSILVLFTRK